MDSVTAAGDAALIFTGYVAMGHLIQAHLLARGLPTEFLHGGTPAARRQEIVDRFQSGQGHALILSVRAAGTGLNLTRAGHVIHFDRPWNPAVEDQATDRAHRIGQHRTVNVHHLIAEGTVEDRISALLERKRGLTEAVLAGGESALTELDDGELRALVSLSQDLGAGGSARRRVAARRAARPRSSRRGAAAGRRRGRPGGSDAGGCLPGGRSRRPAHRRGADPRHPAGGVAYRPGGTPDRPAGGGAAAAGARLPARRDRRGRRRRRGSAGEPDQMADAVREVRKQRALAIGELAVAQERSPIPGPACRSVWDPTAAGTRSPPARIAGGQRPARPSHPARLPGGAAGQIPQAGGR